ncbi:hypothetical protein K491DRAFT_614591 [Lophiostoma macrostomum CBS 122681]|uniref:DUF1640-domain-containing protein n=1 Tax=Lophiostoma macrostomum CBS 122681 TaxID=1314788 RepID=A0A6A6SMP6_9PLEO|nr:hypothetical protein K491DRAFT_614591 [Lophiostoma macrostomum CBS 122681]
MAAPRLPFLWPMLFRPSNTSRAAHRIARSEARKYVTSTASAQDARPHRYGTAHEPAPHLREPQEGKGKTEAPASEQKPQKPPAEDEASKPAPATSSPTRAQTAEAADPVLFSPPPDPPRVPESKPLDTVLHMPSPAEEEQRKPPHLKTPPYVHHFDTYSLVKQLDGGGFTPEQSVFIMKAVRGILTGNMELAREGLVSKSNVENETYLFRAACSELQTEIGNNRKGEMEKMRTERTQLQHEVDILNQRLGQETSHLKDELKGLFDDRKMAVRQEQRVMETKLQELNYKITVALNSDARSEVEGLRWVLTRRAAMTVAAAAFMLFLSLRYSSYLQHAQLLDEKKRAQEQRPPPDQGQNNSNPPAAPPGGALMDEEALGGELLASKGGVSLA